jgi:hypothetical protein
MQVEVIEAGMQGAFTSEDVLEQALRVNHELLRTLEAEKSGETLPVDDGLKKAAGTDRSHVAPVMRCYCKLRSDVGDMQRTPAPQTTSWTLETTRCPPR